MKYVLLFFSFFLISIHNNNNKNSATTKSKATNKQFKNLIRSWKSCPKGRKKFIMTNHKKEKLMEGYLEWDLNKNEWIFYYEKETIFIRNNKIIVKKKNSKHEKTYKSHGFSKILALPIENWDEAMPFDNEIEIGNTSYTEFRTNKSFFIIYFQMKPFKLITITFGENRENYVLFFDEVF